MIEFDFDCRATSQDLFTVMGAMYGAVLFLGINNCGTVQPMVGIERTVFYRERAAGMYSAIPYALAQVLIEVPYVIVQTLVYALITYSMINFEWTPLKFFWYSYFMFLMFISFTYYGIASIVASFFYSFFNLFSGFLIPKPVHTPAFTH
jgi:ABC-type multidrug transport system permease subunit